MRRLGVTALGLVGLAAVLALRRKRRAQAAEPQRRYADYLFPTPPSDDAGWFRFGTE